MLKTKTVTVLTTPTAISANDAFWIRNNGPDVAFLGDSTVTADTAVTGGFQLAAGAMIQLFSGEDLYAVVAATKTATVTVLY